MANDSPDFHDDHTDLGFGGFGSTSSCVGDDGFVGILTLNLRVASTRGGWAWFGGDGGPVVEEVRSGWIGC